MVAEAAGPFPLRSSPPSNHTSPLPNTLLHHGSRIRGTYHAYYVSYGGTSYPAMEDNAEMLLVQVAASSRIWECPEACTLLLPSSHQSAYTAYPVKHVPCVKFGPHGTIGSVQDIPILAATHTPWCCIPTCNSSNVSPVSCCRPG